MYIYIYSILYINEYIEYIEMNKRIQLNIPNL